jgi:hypothetical protein
MEEDVVGTMRTLNTFNYVECSRCAKMTPASNIHVIPSDALGAISEYEQLCSECYEALSLGDEVLPSGDSG